MNIILCFFNLFKPRNWLMLLAIVFNIALCVIVGNYILINILEISKDNFLYNSLAIVGAYLVIEIILMTPIGEWILRQQFKIDEIIRDENSKPIYEIFDNLVVKARKNNRFLSKRIKLYIQESNDINAFAFGSRTVCITRGLASLPLNQISGILAHEFGHINYYDSYISLLTLHGNALFGILMQIAALPFLFVALIFDCLISAIFKAEDCRVCRDLVHFIKDLIITIVNTITNVCFFIRSRIIEYRADAYTSLIGEKNNLSEGLKTLLDTYGEPKLNLLEVVFSSHPKTTKRIERLKFIPNQEF